MGFSGNLVQTWLCHLLVMQVSSSFHKVEALVTLVRIHVDAFGKPYSHYMLTISFTGYQVQSIISCSRIILN